MFGIVLGAALVRTAIPLSALGYPNGIPLGGGAVTLRLPLYPGVQRVGIRFPIEVRGGPHGAEVRVHIDGREVARVANEQLTHALVQIDVPLPRGADSIDVTLFSRLPECSGAHAAAEVRVASAGAIIVTQDRDAARSPRDSYAGAYTVIESPHADAAWQAHALAAAYALHAIESWRRIRVALGATPEPGSVGVTDVSAIAPTRRASPKGTLTFAQLGVSPLVQSGENVTYTLAFTLGQLDGVPNRVVATLHVRASAPASIEAVFNGREINAFAVAAGTRDVRLPIPTAALRGANTLRIVVLFDHPQAFCAAAAPQIALEGSSLRWTGRGDVPMTLERRIGELSGKIVVESDPAIFAQAFVVMNTLGSVNQTIDAIDARPLQPGMQPANEIEIGVAPSIETPEGGSYGEVRVEPNGAVRISYIGDPTVLNRLPTFGGVLARSEATRFEFAATGAPLTQGGPFASGAQQRQAVRRIIIGAFVVVLVAATWLIARRARRFS